MSIALQELETDTILMNSGAFANLLRMRDRFVGIHSERIRSLTRNVCERLDLSWTEGRLIETAAQLHDLGTIAIPDPILHKNGILTPEERLIMQGHAQFGYEALEKATEFAPVAEIVRHHHERFDGTGYPDRLAGDDIPLGARLIGVLDAYDAMTSERVYRQSKTDREAAEELILGKGTQFDPEVVDAVLKTIRFGVH